MVWLTTHLNLSDYKCEENVSVIYEKTDWLKCLFVDDLEYACVYKWSHI